MAKNTVTAYLKEDEARRFKAICVLQGVKLTTALRSVILATIQAEEAKAIQTLKAKEMNQ